MQEGTIARLNTGYGFIAINGREKDLFFHATALLNAQFNDLQVGNKVSFEEGMGEKGPNAVKVNLVS